MPAAEFLPVDRSADPNSILHGGSLAAARGAFPDAAGPWIDLSTGINPHAYPVGEVPPAAWQRLPDRDEASRLEQAARTCYQIPADCGLVAAPGTQALIQLLPRLRPARRVGILGFGYQEHPATWRRAGAKVSIVDDLDGLAAADVAIATNPNNPDGRCLAPADLVTLAHGMARQGRLLVVDEAFADALDQPTSLVPHLRGAGALVLRSFGKFFGLAGLRLGFAIGEPELCSALERALGPWAVSGPALVVGARALADLSWQAAMRATLAAEAIRLDARLHAAGFAPVGGTPLFRLAEHPDAAGWYERLGRAGILVRRFPDRPRWLRFGLPGDPAAWQRLALALGV